MTKPKVYILNRFAGDNPNYTSWMSDCPYPCQIIDEYAPDWKVPADAGIVVTHMHYRWEEVSTLRRIHEASRIPILILADGILEYRNTWENPNVADGSCFQPLLGHKLACIGRAQARTVESWGNVGRCEVVGLPKLDSVQDAQYLPIQSEGPFRVLVATANTPAFNTQQRNKVVESLKAITHRCENKSLINGRNLEITWRLTDGLGTQLGIQASREVNVKPIPISDAIELADAVITTPSTLYLESVMKRRPTAILDFTNSPSYVGSAWTISAPNHLNSILKELENPPPAKMLFQRSILHDNLETGVSSKSRLYALIDVMVKSGAAARRNGTRVSLPTRVLADPQRGIQQVEAEFNAAILYRDNPNFRIGEVERLQQELNQAVARLGQLPRDLDAKHAGNQVMAKQVAEAEARILAGLEREKQHLALVDQKSEIIAKKSEHIKSLQKLFEEANGRARSLSAAAQRAKVRFQQQRDAAASKVTPEVAMPRIQMPAAFPLAVQADATPNKAA